MKTKRSKEEVAAWRASMRSVAKALRSMTPADREAEIARVGSIVTCEGHYLTWHNALFLARQSQNGIVPSMVGGFRQWGKVGRQVRKGCRATGYIYVPTTRKIPATATEEEKDELRFRLVPVWDVTGTEEIGAAVPADGSEVAA